MHRFVSIFMKICNNSPLTPEGGIKISEYVNKKLPLRGLGGFLSWQEKLEWE
jgi:hypothetical protein